MYLPLALCVAQCSTWIYLKIATENLNYFLIMPFLYIEFLFTLIYKFIYILSTFSTAMICCERIKFVLSSALRVFFENCVALM